MSGRTVCASNHITKPRYDSHYLNNHHPIWAVCSQSGCERTATRKRLRCDSSMQMDPSGRGTPIYTLRFRKNRRGQTCCDSHF